MKKAKLISIYVIADLLTAMLAWFLFTNYRFFLIKQTGVFSEIFYESNFRYLLAIFGLPILWNILYFLAGYYRKIYQKSRLKELWQTFLSSLVGVIIIFFTLILDDEVLTYQNYYALFVFLLVIHFLLTWIARLTITSIVKLRIAKGKIGFPTLLIGSSEKALKMYEDIQNNDETYGYKFVGYINLGNSKSDKLSDTLKNLGDINNLNKIIEKYNVEEVVLAIDSSKYHKIESIITKLSNKNVIIKVIPSMSNVLMGKVNMSFFLGTPLIVISHQLMPAWQESVKRIFDIFSSLVAIVLLTPLYIGAMIAVKLSSKGTIFYKQERIGKNNKPFFIYKFRTMVADAEKNGPQLSSAHDPRITKVGRIMRKYRIDEIPQFFNVIKGDMSLVGPRPERQFYIDQISAKAPEYYRLLKVRPGITSWGAVKYGYTENLEQMLEQLKYDIFYIENMSLYLDFKILLYTVGVVLKKQGK